MNPNFLSLSVSHALHAAESMQDQYAEFLQAQYHFHGLPNPRMELQEGEGALLLALRKLAGGTFRTNPSPDEVMRPGDVVIAVGTPEQINELRRQAGSSKVDN